MTRDFYTGFEIKNGQKAWYAYFSLLPEYSTIHNRSCSGLATKGKYFLSRGLAKRYLALSRNAKFKAGDIVTNYKRFNDLEPNVKVTFVNTSEMYYECKGMDEVLKFSDQEEWFLRGDLFQMFEWYLNDLTKEFYLYLGSNEGKILKDSNELSEIVPMTNPNMFKSMKIESVRNLFITRLIGYCNHVNVPVESLEVSDQSYIVLNNKVLTIY